jgi:uncharacterized protein (UPF0212 family)
MAARILTCPHCGESFSSTDPCTAGATMCPDCGKQFDVATTNRSDD